MMEAKKSPSDEDGREGATEYVLNNFNTADAQSRIDSLAEIEKSLLCVLIERKPEAEVILGSLNKGDFRSQAHQDIFAAVKRFYDSAVPFDLLLLTNELNRIGGPERLDGGDWGSYLTWVTESALPVIAEVADSHIRELGKASRLREISEVASEVYKSAARGDTDTIQALLGRLTTLQSRDAETRSRLKIVSAADLPGIEPPDSLWGGLIYPATITQLNSEPGAGKSTLAYNLAALGARGEAFLNIPYSKPIKTLYVDLETPEWLRRQKIESICDELPAGFHLLSEIDLARDLSDLIRLCGAEGYDLVIFDTQSRVLMLEDENDNAAGNRAAAMLSRITRETGAAVLLIHHAKKGEGGKDVYKGRGASAFAAAVDVVLNFEALDLETLKLKTAKSRVPGMYSSITMRKAGGDRFERAAVEEANPGLELHRTQDLILNLLGPGGEWKTGEIVGRGKDRGYSERSVKRALDRLRQSGKVERVRQGVYVLSGSELLDEAPGIVQ